MLSSKIVSKANAKLPEILPHGLIAVFIGATSGIGRSALKQFATATNGKSPVIYVVGRNASAAVPLLAELRQSNSSAKVKFIEQDVSLVKNIDRVVDQIREHEDKVDLLFMSPGFIAFHGRQETSEGLEPSMTTRYYSRARAIQLLLPLLNRSSNPHVTNIAAGGEEGPMLEDDLDLERPGNYSFIRGSVHSATMLTLTLERFASENPKISFVHAFPGLTATPTLTRGSSGFVSILLRWIVSPIINTFVASSVEEVGARALFYATNARFTVDETATLAVPIPDGLSKAGQTEGGVFLAGAKGETPRNGELLKALREQLASKIWDHTQTVFNRVTQ